MVFGGALFTGVSHMQAPGGANVEDTHRVLMTIMGGTVAVAGVVLLSGPEPVWALSRGSLLLRLCCSQRS
jgi:hypothetical protein